MMNLAPIVLFVYNRLVHTRHTIKALQDNTLAKESELYIFADGEKAKNDSKVKEVREFIKTIKGFKNITIIESETNKGLATSIIEGVSEVVNEHGKIIVLEDDLVTSPYFLEYMNSALDMYERSTEVASIAGYSFFNEQTEQAPSFFFLKLTTSWGWATWKDRWALFEENGQILLEKVLEAGREKEFDLDGAYPYLEMLKNQIAGRNSSWAIRWYASTFLLDKLTLYSNTPYVTNIGFDGSGEHCEINVEVDIPVQKESKLFTKTSTHENKEIREKFLQNIRFRLQTDVEEKQKKKKFFFSKEKIDNKRIITIFGLIKFSYIKH